MGTSATTATNAGPCLIRGEAQGEARLGPDHERTLSLGKPTHVHQSEILTDTTRMKLEGPDRAEVSMVDGKPPRFFVDDGKEISQMTAEEKTALASNLDRRLSAHELSGDDQRVAQKMLDGLVQDPEVDTRWAAPNTLRDAALSDGTVTDRPAALGRRPGQNDEITLTNGNSAEATMFRSGSRTEPVFAKQMADGRIVELAPEDAIALRDNLKRQGPAQADLVRDLDRYIRRIDPSSSADTFERGTSREEQARRYAAGL